VTRSGDSADYRAAFSAERTSVAVASQWLQDVCCENGVPQEALERLDICLNEALANIVSHGGPNTRSQPVDLELVFRELTSASIADLTISDVGFAFDPTLALPRPLTASLEEAQPGGLGIIMLRNNADALSYQHADGLNRLTISVRWPSIHE
jgi:anti-sigma regulatory factor (Ser/Thr protein kinase)